MVRETRNECGEEHRVQKAFGKPAKDYEVDSAHTLFGSSNVDGLSPSTLLGPIDAHI
jgi:hypothetical protein